MSLRALAKQSINITKIASLTLATTASAFSVSHFLTKQFRNIFLILCIFILGATFSSIKWTSFSKINLPNNHVICDGRIQSIQNKTAGKKIVINIQSCANDIEKKQKTFSIKASLFCPEPCNNVGEGRLIRFRTSLKKPKDFKNPGAFPYSKWLAGKGISAIGSITPDWIVSLDTNQTIKERIQQRITKSMNLSDSSPFLFSLMLGKKDLLSKTTRSDFSKSGISHILAISGLHVGFALFMGFLSALILGFIRPNIYLRIPRIKLSACLGIPLMWLYIFISGSPPSAIRAGIMLSIITLFLLKGLKANWLSLLSIALILMISYSPLIIFDISFQLSFSAILGIILITPRIIPRNSPKFTQYIVGLIAVSISAIIATLPLAAKYFNEVSVMGIFTNIVVIPYVAFIIFPMAFIAMVFSLINPFFAHYIWVLVNYVTEPFLKFIQLLSQHSERFIFNLSPTNFEIFVYYFAICVIIFWKDIKYKKLALIACAILFSAIFIGDFMPKKFNVRFLDVGQGDATLVQFSNGQNILIDGGGLKHSDFDVGRNIIAPALWNLGIRKIDDLYLTHPHHDHYRGLAYIAETFSPKRLFTNGTNAPIQEEDEWNEFTNRIDKTNIEVIEVDSAYPPIEYGNGKITILFPFPNLAKTLSTNNASLVLSVEEENKKVLITGDLEKEGETLILHSQIDIKSEILKVCHHGSKTSSINDFLLSVSPQTAVISVGNDNPYGMPDSIILKRLEALGAKIKRTDQDGMISISELANNPL